MTEFIPPTIEIEEIKDNLSRFIVEPLEHGYGETLGNSMRRVLLNSLTGAKVTAIKIEGVDHEFTTAPGVVEDVTDIVLNIKGKRLIFALIELSFAGVVLLAQTRFTPVPFIYPSALHLGHLYSALSRPSVLKSSETEI